MLYSINFGDSHKNISAESSLMLLYALGVKDKNMLWYMKQVEQGQHRDGYFLNRPMGFLYTPELTRAPELPDLKLSQLFADFGWATIRTSWKKDATMLAVKSGHTWNHSHADANSFILFHKGVDIIKDAGNCWYPNPNYRNYFFQSQAHNVVLFNGQGQSREQQYHGSTLRGYLYHLLDGGNIRYLLANGTGPVSDNFSRNFRHFLWIDNVIYMIDDLKTHRSGEFEWLWHPGGEWKKSGADVTITKDNSSVVLRPLYPRLLALSDFVHDYPDDLYWEEITAPTENLQGTEKFLALVKKYTDFSELTPAMINEFVEKILVHQAEGKGASRTQEVEIFFNFIGKVEIPRKEIELTEEEKAALAEQERRRAKKAEYNRRYMEKKRRQWKEQQEREKEQQEALELPAASTEKGERIA